MADSQTFKVEVDFVAKNQELFDKANKQAKDLTAATKSIKNAYEQYGDELKQLNPELVKQIELEKKQAAAMQLNKEKAVQLNKEIREMRAQAKEIRAANALLLDQAADIDRIAKPLFTGGAFIVGGIFAAANKYVANAKEATETTIAWKKAQEDLNASGLKIGEVLATQALPLLIKAAELTAKVATFIEANPEVVKFGLNAGIFALTAGALLKAYSGGIRLYADLKMDAALTLQYTAAQLQLKAAQTQLAASTGGKGAGVAGTVATTAAGAGGLSVGGFVGIAAASAAFTLALSVGFAKLVQSLTGVELPILKVINYLKGLGNQSEESAAQATVSLEQEKAATQAAHELRAQERELRLEEAKKNVEIYKEYQAERIRSLITSFTQESTLRRQALTAGLNDLTKGLNAELRLKQDYFRTLLNSVAEAFRAAWNRIQSLLGLTSSAASIGSASGGSVGSTATASGGTASSTWSLGNLFGTRDSGGYVNKGLYRMAWNGNTEFVANGPTTRALEKMVGSKLTQENLLAAAGGGQYTINNNSRFSGEYTNSMRRAVKQDTRQAVSETLKGMLK